MMKKIKILFTLLVISVTLFSFQVLKSDKVELDVKWKKALTDDGYTRAMVTFSSQTSSQLRTDIRHSFSLFYGRFVVLSCDANVEVWQWKAPVGWMGWPAATDGAEKPMDFNSNYTVIWDNNVSCQLPN